MCKLFDSYEESLHLGVCKLAKYEKNALFSGKIYTADKNFTRPPVATVATNFKSAPLLLNNVWPLKLGCWEISLLSLLSGLCLNFPCLALMIAGYSKRCTVRNLGCLWTLDKNIKFSPRYYFFCFSNIYSHWHYTTPMS